ncbi:MAG TPA: regulatory protein RecX [Bacteroidia bacterium]|jgi:regulatory protein|nr:regulatory protein RecX [Bacteroidia bacterium]
MEAKHKIYTALQALTKIQDWCGYQERCQQEVRDKLYDYGLHSADVENIISRLISDNFINEERFAKAYAGGKFRIKKWGRVKIKMGLKAKRVSDYCIKKGLEEINHTDYIRILKKILESKSALLKEKNKIRKKYKLMQFAAAKGYEQEYIMEILNEGF